MRRPATILAAVTVLALVLVAPSMVRGQGCIVIECGERCWGCCPYGGGCLYDYQHDACYITCGPPPPPGGGSDRPPVPQAPDDCWVDPTTGAIVCWGESLSGSGGITMPSDKVPLEVALNVLMARTGIPFLAPTVKKRSLKLTARNVPGDQILAAIADQLHAVAVVRGQQGAIELIPRMDLAARAFSTNSTGASSPLKVDFKGLPLIDAARYVASSAGIDLVLPLHWSGSINASFDGAQWREVLQAVADAAGQGGQVQASRNGLVQIEP